jgi:aryl-alcohol dehydrogenase-like predicted oxidoreductase
MRARTLGTGAAALETSAIGLGCMGFSHAFGSETPMGEAIRTIRQAHEMGYTLFDDRVAKVGVGTFPS